MAFQRVLDADELWSGEMSGRKIGATKLLLVRIDGVYHAFEDRCAHLGAELSRGRLEGRVLTCSVHAWQYDAANGQGINPARACLKRFPVEVRDGAVFVDLDPRPEAGGR